MIERWSRDQVLALAPDAASQKAAHGVAAPGKWSSRGTTGTVVYGECKGSGSKPYLACVDLAEPAYRCSCPSRKFPCKHALGLLLMWSADGLPVAEGAPQWVTEWLDGRAERAARSAAKIEAARAKAAEATRDTQDPENTGNAENAGNAEDADGFGDPGGSGGSGGSGSSGGSGGSGGSGVSEGSGSSSGPGGSGSSRGSGDSGSVVVGADSGTGAGGADGGGRRARGVGAGGESVRHARVAAGLAELERWLADQVRQGLAGAAEHDWDGLAKRLIDAQAPGAAGVVSRLSRVRSEDDWPGRLLAEYALANLLAVAYRRRSELPPALVQTVLSRAGFPVTREEVLAGASVRDQWDVLGRRDEEQDRLTARRVWLRGRHTRRAALVLSFAPPGQPLDASLVTGTTIDADLAYYPGAAPLRALVAARHDLVPAAVPPGVSPEEGLREVAAALAGDPWTESWPLVLAGVVPERGALGGLPLHPRARDPWRLIAVSGGRPVTVAAEWTPRGLRPLTTWDDNGAAVIL
ncbi:SWIM zinc finger family protein [Nonomuraea jiangxiensis]|uniref:SWIM zinc finger family protein n=1 Tax=Nonomuraea jiangxiensis TaxID=633440 RepID=UPI003CCC42E0